MSQRPREESIKESMQQMTYIIEDEDRKRDAWICHLGEILVE